jgi:imidazolonepropionase-like amidohydrolase
MDEIKISRRRLLELGGAGIAGASLAGFARAAAPPAAIAQGGGLQPAPARRPGEGHGPVRKLVVRGGTLVDGTGRPPRGPVDIVAVNQRITQIKAVDPAALDARRAPFDADYEVDARGMFVLPGFVDLHVHGGGPPKNAEAEYPYKLWLAHGVTTVRGVSLSSNAFSVSEKARSERNEIAAPRIFNYQHPADGWADGPVDNAAKARAWVRWAKDNGVDGVKVRNGDHMRPDIFAALMDEARKLDLGTVAHLDQRGVEHMNAIQAARLGLGTVTHFYGHFESLLRKGEPVFPPDYDYSDEQVRFSQVTEWIDKIAPVGGHRWRAYLEEHLRLGTVFDPTFNIYVASRDVVRMRTAEWHDRYTLPSLWQFFQPSPVAHGSYYRDWGTEVETAWKRFYNVWFQLVRDYHAMGGRITTGTDSGFIYQTYGFGFIEELELLREAGLEPLDVITAATQSGARTLYEPMGVKDPPIGTVQPGKRADLVVAPANPLGDLSKPAWARRGGGFKTLYGTGHERLNEQTGKIERVGGIRWTIKDGVVYDAPKLLEDVAAMVARQKAQGVAARRVS